MTTARSVIVNREITRYYHLISRCVRKAHLCGEGKEHRKNWLESRLEELSGIFSIEVCGYAMMDNHLHLLVRLSDGTCERNWSPVEVSQRWARLFPRHDQPDNPMDSTNEWIKARSKEDAWVETTRSRLGNLGWFMKSLKEPLARIANREDRCTGAFWEGRYRSIAILDEPSLVATCTYIDLNPLAAGLAKLPEDSRHTSIRTRVESAKLQEARKPLVDTDVMPEATHWLAPLGESSAGEGMVEGLNLNSYLEVVDWMARVRRPGKRSIENSAPSILARIGIAIEPLRRRVESLSTKVREKWIGTVAGEPESVRAAAIKRGVPWVKNLWSIHA